MHHIYGQQVQQYLRGQEDGRAELTRSARHIHYGCLCFPLESRFSRSYKIKNSVKHMIREGQIRNFSTLNVKHYLFDAAEDARNQRTQRSSV